MSTRKAFLLGGLAVFLVLVLAFALIGIFVPSSEDELASAGQTPTTAPVPTSMPTFTPFPTATRVPTSVPTSTPVPTLTATLIPMRTPPPVTSALPMPFILALETQLDHVNEYASITGPSVSSTYGYSGHECFYTQVGTTLDTPDYFYPDDNWSTTILIFEDDICMTYTNDPTNMSEKVIATIYAQRLMNKLITNWHDVGGNANFQTDLNQLVRTPLHGEPESRGWCIQSSRYVNQSVLVEYFADVNGIRAIMHSDGAGPCTE